MSELRNRMHQDLRLAGLSEGTRHTYLRAVKQLAAYYGRSPDQLGEPRQTSTHWVPEFGRWFHRAVGHAAEMLEAASRAGRRWFQGLRRSSQAFG